MKITEKQRELLKAAALLHDAKYIAKDKCGFTMV